jgi:glutamyl-tRNA reductase
MELLLVGVNHHSAPAAIRDALSMEGDELRLFLERFRNGDSPVGEVAVLSTCHRTEIYAGADDPDAAERVLREALDRHKGVTYLSDGGHCYTGQGREAAHQLFRVASGLDSLMLGEHQVLGQVRDACALAEEAGTARALLTRTFAAATNAGSKARNETGIARGAVSVALAAVRMATKVLGDLSSKRVLVIGAGETGTLVARHFTKERPQRLVVVNRTAERACTLADELGGLAVRFEQLHEVLRESDVVVTATASPEPVLRRDAIQAVMKKRRTEPLVVVDIASPRDVEPEVGELSNVFLYDLDSLESIVQQNRASRAKEVPKAEKVLERELKHFMEWYRALQVKPTIRALRQTFEEIGAQEAERHAKHFDESSRDALARYTRSLINKLLHQPTSRIKQVDRASSDGIAILEAVDELFQLNGNGGDGTEGADDARREPEDAT